MNSLINFLSSYLSIPKPATATITISILVFILGLFLNETIKEIGRYRQRRNFKKLLKRNYLIFKNYLFVQSTNMQTFSSQINEDSNPNFNIFVSPCSAISNFKDISYSNAFKSLFTGLENFRLFNFNRRLQAFDYLYESLAMYRIEEERIFPILASYQNEALPVVQNINSLNKQAIENIGDLTIKITSTLELNLDTKIWLQKREAISNVYYKGLRKAEDSQKYFIDISEFEFNNSAPIQVLYTPKEFWNYHHQLRLAAAENIKLIRLFKNTISYCNKTSERFRSTGIKLSENYRYLFGQKVF
ncbi:hypothetical protein DHW03_18085 [Pedobacter yonginense]|uniref:Uncharacterized protein n=1 Tax=Pedobacter yonginense TaxID=651869 RepID=A0A317EH27_9SPHI|nr:hypothetical protein [Pedobacter yonginense]PWS25962.1 hypothetical protein DHW03_18085 [Pedobacter yonginense]